MPLPLPKQAVRRAFRGWGEGCSVSSAPQPGPRGLGEGLQEISAVMYSKPPGWKCSKSEIAVVVLYLVPVSSGDLKG